MAAAAAAARKWTPVTWPAPRKHYCSCGRFLGEGTVRDGWIRLRCQGCGRHRRIWFDGRQYVID